MNYYNRNEYQKTAQEGKAKVMLLFPPAWRPFQPYLSLPSLTAFLREKGYKVIQKDVNVEAYNKLLTKERLKKSLQVVSKKILELENKKKLSPQKQKQYTALSIAALGGPYVIENVEKAKKTFKDEKAFYDFEKLSESKSIISRGLRLLSAEYYPTIFSLSGYTMKYSHRSTNDIMKAIGDEKSNLFIRFYKEHVIPDIIHENPVLVGISIAYDTQIIPGLTLAGLIKNKLPETHIVVGGPVFTYLIDELKENSRIFSIIDSLVVNEGETALPQLVEAVKNKRSLKEIPNLMYCKRGKVFLNKQVFLRDINSLPTPCYDGLPLRLYFSPK